MCALLFNLNVFFKKFLFSLAAFWLSQASPVELSLNRNSWRGHMLHLIKLLLVKATGAEVGLILKGRLIWWRTWVMSVFFKQQNWRDLLFLSSLLLSSVSSLNEWGEAPYSSVTDWSEARTVPQTLSAAKVFITLARSDKMKHGHLLNPHAVSRHRKRGGERKRLREVEQTIKKEGCVF